MARQKEQPVSEFTIDGITLHVRDRFINPPLRKALENGQYERQEVRALKRHLQPGDRLLDIGSGIGFVAAQAARVVGGANVVAVEPTPGLIPSLRQNLEANDGQDVRVIHGAVVPDSHQGERVNFTVGHGFWSSALSRIAGRGKHRGDVPALPFSRLLDEIRPSVVTMDVEGAEIELCEATWPASVRLMVVELHPGVRPPADIRRLFDAMSRSGFAYMPWGSVGPVVVFERLQDDTPPGAN